MNKNLFSLFFGLVILSSFILALDPLDISEEVPVVDESVPVFLVDSEDEISVVDINDSFVVENVANNSSGDSFIFKYKFVLIISLICIGILILLILIFKLSKSFYFGSKNSDNKIKNYIREGLSKGYKKNDLIEILKKVGYSEEYLSKQFNEIGK
jgi:hypothetical protein